MVDTVNVVVNVPFIITFILINDDGEDSANIDTALGCDVIDGEIAGWIRQLLRRP